MATSPNTGQSSHKNRFWSKFRGVPKPIPRRKRVTSDSVLTTPSPSSHFSPLTLSGHTHKPHTTPTAKCDDDIPSYKFVTDEMTLPEFALQFQNELPQQVVVTHGVYWKENLEVNISSSERLNIHFIRHRESVKIKELGSKTEYSVPVTSTLEFGPVYNPFFCGNISDARRGFLYPTVLDLLKIIDHAPLPRLICATSDSVPTTPGDCVSKGELLLIKEVRSSNSLGYKQLQVMSLTTKTDKFLHESCRGNFTTRPESVKLSLLSVIKYMSHSLPLSVMIFPGDNLDVGDEHYPSHLFQKVIRLTRTFTDVLLVASSVPDGTVCDSREPFEIPQEVELELRVVELNEADEEQLKKKSEEIMHQIQGDYLRQYRNAHLEQADYVVQDMFLRAVGEPEVVAEKSPVAPPRRKKASSVEKSDYDYSNVQPMHEGLLSRLAKLEDTVWNMKKTHASASTTADSPTAQEKEMVKDRVQEKEDEKAAEEIREQKAETPTLVQKLEKKLKEKEKQVEVLELTMVELKSLVEHQSQQFQEELGKMSAELAVLQGEMEDDKKKAAEEVKEAGEVSSVNCEQANSLYQQELLASPETVERNRDIVNSLTAAQVLQLLAELGIEDLQIVEQENISGDILIELNEDELETELGIKKRIHRLKVMKVMDGSKPVTDYIKITEPSSMDNVC